MAVTFTLRLDDTVTQASLDRLAVGAQDMTELMDNIGAVLVAGAVERISSTNMAPDGAPWPKSLRAQLVGLGEAGENANGITLHDTGALMRSITEEPGPNQVRVGSNMIYAGVHQTGATIRAKSAKGLRFTLANGETVMVGSVTIPARPYLGISEDEKADIEALTADYFNGLLSGDAA